MFLNLFTNAMVIAINECFENMSLKTNFCTARRNKGSDGCFTHLRHVRWLQRSQ